MAGNFLSQENLLSVASRGLLGTAEHLLDQVLWCNHRIGGWLSSAKQLKIGDWASGIPQTITCRESSSRYKVGGDAQEGDLAPHTPHLVSFVQC
jgi:hypothetical protein